MVMAAQKFFQRFFSVFLSFIVVSLLTLCSSCILADDQTEMASQVIKVVSPQLKLFGQQSQLGEGVMIIENVGKLPHTLVAVHSGAAKETVLHQSYLDDSGKPMMQQIRQIDILPKNEKTLTSSGLHIMLINIDQNIKSGNTLPIMLLFKDGSELTVSAKIV
jgi:copper(I)-binding protein